jgi:hypothetical protein
MKLLGDLPLRPTGRLPNQTTLCRRGERCVILAALLSSERLPSCDVHLIGVRLPSSRNPNMVHLIIIVIEPNNTASETRIVEHS